MSNSFIDDLDVVDQTTVEGVGPQYPVAQWLHGDPKLAAAGGVAHTGGVILPERYADDWDPAPNWARTTVAFSSGKSEPVLATARLGIAVLRVRFRWFVTLNGQTTYFPRSAYQPDRGMRGHVQALGVVRGWDVPIAVTFKGKASQEFERLLRDFSAKLPEAAQRIIREKAPKAPNGHPSPIRFPRFAFYMRVVPGPHVKVGQRGQESIVTPPVLELPEVIGEDYIAKVYVGRERLQELQTLYHASADWSAAWDGPNAGADSDFEREPAPSDEAQPGPEAEYDQRQPQSAPAEKPAPEKVQGGKPQPFFTDPKAWGVFAAQARKTFNLGGDEAMRILRAAGWTHYDPERMPEAVRVLKAAKDAAGKKRH